MLGTVTRTRVGDIPRGDGLQAQLVQAEFAPRGNIREPVHALGPGIDACPAVGARVLYVSPAGDMKFVVGGFDPITPTTKPGEFELYSTDGTLKLARHRLKANGRHYIAGNGVSLRAVLQTLIEGIQGATYVPFPGGVAGSPVPIVDTTTKLATALTQLAQLLEDTDA